MEAAGSPEMLVPSTKLKQCYIPEDSNLNTHYQENFKACTDFNLYSL
jgi:hypothetical protein